MKPNFCLMKLLYIIILSFVLITGQLSSQIASKNPNIIILMADDISPREFPCYGNNSINTPTIDMLAREGMQFKTAWATPKCQSTRAMLMTGKYAYQTEWYHGSMRPSKESKNWSLYTHTLFSDITNKAGYVSLMAGKYQLNGEYNKHGFDEYFITGDAKKAPENAGKFLDGKKGKKKASCYWNPFVSIHKKDSNKVEWEQTSSDDFGPEMELNYSLSFIDRAIKNEQPFMVYLPVHLGNKNSEQAFPKTPLYNKEGQRLNVLSKASMGAHVEYIDYMLSQLIYKLKLNGVYENTLFIVTTDNGSAGYGKNDVTAQKGVRVPLIISGAFVKSSGLVEGLTDLTDVYATIADICNQPTDGDGKSLLPYLKGEAKTHRDWIYSNLTIHQMVRTKNLLRDGNADFWAVENVGIEEGLKKLENVPYNLKEDLAIINNVLKDIKAPSKDGDMYKKYLLKESGEPKKSKTKKSSKKK